MVWGMPETISLSGPIKCSSRRQLENVLAHPENVGESAGAMTIDCIHWLGLKFTDLDCVHWIEIYPDRPGRKGEGNEQNDDAGS